MFRKNSRKWERKNTWAESISYRHINADEWRQVEKVAVAWLGTKDPETIVHDFDVLERFLSRPRLDAAGLFRGRELMGFNIWDVAVGHYPIRVNFRYSMCKPEPWLSEFLRLSFYQNIGNVYVNDGGVLDNPNLKAFKDKLNPRSVRTVRGGKP